MPGQAVFPAGISETPGETLALSTTLASVGVPPGTHRALIYVPSTSFRLHLNPAIRDVRFYDASAAAGSRFIDVYQVLTDRATGTGTGTAMDSATTSDRLYVCVSDVVGGFRFTIGNANGNASVLSVAYSKNNKTFAALTIGSDGTIAAAGKTMGQTGDVTWTAPTDFLAQSLSDLGVTDLDAPSTFGVWFRFAWDGAFDSSTSLTELWTLNKNTSRGYFHLGQEYELPLNPLNVGALEAVLAGGTDTMDITWIKGA